MVTNAVLARCCNRRITSTSRLCYRRESDKLCRLWIKNSSKPFFLVSLDTSIYGFCGLRDRPTSLLPPYTFETTRRAFSHQKSEHEWWLQSCHYNKTHAWKFSGCHGRWSDSHQLCINSQVELYTQISPPSGCKIFLYLLLCKIPRHFGQKLWPFSGS